MRKIAFPLGWPAPCPICHDWTRSGLCGACVRRFAPGTALQMSRCRCCAIPLGPPGPVDQAPAEAAPASPAMRRCGACIIHPPPVSLTCAAVDYSFPWDRLIAAFKFSGQPELAGALAPLMLRSVRQTPQHAPEAAVDVDLICPVPLWHGRLAERGYNQAWELARRVAAGLGKPAAAGLLQRWRETATQSRLGRLAREQNIRGAFIAPARAATQIAGRHIALVDDVMTTGSTAFEAARTLRQNGAASVQLWVLARVTAAEPG